VQKAKGNNFVKLDVCVIKSENHKNIKLYEIKLPFALCLLPLYTTPV